MIITIIIFVIKFVVVFSSSSSSSSGTFIDFQYSVDQWSSGPKSR